MKAMLPGSTADATKPVVLGEAPEPEPAADEAVVAVEAYSVNRGETFQLDGGLDRRWAGWRPGKDVAGTVIRAAANGTGPTAGTRVVAHPRRTVGPSASPYPPRASPNCPTASTR